MMQIKSMAQNLNRNNKLHSPRKEHFSNKFMEDLETLMGVVAVEICQRHIKVVQLFPFHVSYRAFFSAGRK